MQFTKEDKAVWARLKLKKQLAAGTPLVDTVASTDADEEIIWDVMTRANFKPLTWLAYANA